MIERNVHLHLIECACGFNSIVYYFTCYKSTRNCPRSSVVYNKVTQSIIMSQIQQCTFEHPCPLYANRLTYVERHTSQCMIAHNSSTIVCQCAAISPGG